MTPRTLACSLLAAVVLYGLLVLVFSLEPEPQIDTTGRADQHWQTYQDLRSER